jgi:hypothetical protein
MADVDRERHGEAGTTQHWVSRITFDGAYAPGGAVMAGPRMEKKKYVPESESIMSLDKDDMRPWLYDNWWVLRDNNSSCRQLI